VGKFRIEIEKKARKDFKKIYASGNKADIKKLEKIILELAEHPTTLIGIT